MKSLTLQGFKSFVGRTAIELPDGVAAVVGPNGSGKSNIADAIRWVLGEQSVRLLRGNKLEDVIFSGSESRRPVGMAEVSLTFDNSSGAIPLDYSEVTVTRRVFRSGESEFFINKKACRLRDIQELFLDTGLGRGSMAIIGQGEVAAILSAKPEERRAFLDEAAGVAKYRVRKREALLKLAQTTESLHRVRDIIAEVESRLGPLAEQARVAREAESIRTRLLHVETAWLKGERAALRAAKEQVDVRSSALAAEAQKVRAELSAHEERLERLDADVDGMQLRLESLREDEAKAERDALSAAHRMEMLKERIDRALAESAERRRRLDGLRAEADRIRAERSAAEEALQASTERWTDLTERLRSVQVTIERSLAGHQEEETEIDALRAALMEATEELGAAKSRLAALEEASSMHAEALQTLQERREALSAQGEAAHQSQARAEATLEELTAGVERLRAQLRAAKEDDARLRDEQRELARRLGLETAALQEAKARRDALAAVWAGREGYARGVREVLGATKSRSWGLLGAVAELIRVDRRLEVAIDTALGAASQYVVAKTDRDAQEAIQFLKERQAGRVTFLPLDFLKVQTLAAGTKERITGSPGVVGIAADLIECVAEAQPALSYLLGRVVITEDIESAISLSKRLAGFSRAVTLDGDVVVPHGALTGGSRRGKERGESLLARRRRLAELTEAVEARAKEVERLKEDHAKLEEEIARSTRGVAQLEDALRRIELEKAQAERDAREAQAAADRIASSLRELDAQHQEALRRGEASASEMQGLAERIDAATSRREQLLKELAEREGRVAEHREAVEARRQNARELELAVAKAEHEREERTREIARLERELAAIEREQAGETEALARLTRLQAQAEGERRAAEEAGAEAQERVKGARRALEELSATLAAKRSERAAAQQAASPLRLRLQQLQEEQVECRVEGERLALRDEQLQARIDELGIAPEQLAAAESAKSPSALRSEMRSLERALAALGPVNPHSIAEHEETSERHRFLTAQQADLEEAILRLEEVIERLDRESGTQFLATFEAVRRAFQHSFTRLFGGGRADLTLTDPDDPLESGIEIDVQPPGKKMQSLLALSGGEKALAAVALLFAQLEAKPIPFCVLDEVDAALDEHNLERFRSLLLEYAKETQFLIITHRQTTMEGCERLFGVTMEEAGVSTLVALDLAERTRHHARVAAGQSAVN